jgi:GT2 family glycosyltransferase
VTLVLPVPSDATAPDLLATIDVLVRTTPKTVDAEVLAVLSPGLDSSVRDLFQQLGGDLRHVTSAVSLSDARTAAEAVAAALQESANATAPICVILDPHARPDLSDLTDRIARLSPLSSLRPAPIPFSHRPGALLARTADLVATADPADDAPPCRTLTVELAGRLATSARQAASSAVADLPDPLIAVAPTSAPSSVVLVANAPTATVEAAVAAVRKAAPGSDVVVVDPHGDAARSSALQRLRGIRVVSAGAGHPVNEGIRHARGRVVALLDPRAIVGKRFLDGLSAALADDVVAVGPRFNIDAGWQRVEQVAYTSLPGFHTEAEHRRRTYRGQQTEVQALAGPCLLLRRDAVLSAGGLDPAYSTDELALLDVQLRLAANGGRFLIAEDVLVHLSGQDSTQQSGRWQLGGTGTALLRARHGDDADRRLPGIVAATLIVKDEVSRLGRCLETVTGLVDDVVICDTGSSDDTVALAEALGATVTHFDWCDDFSAARNAALTAHVGGWTLQVDADDQVVCADVPALRRQLDGLELDAVQVVYRTFADDSRDEAASTDVLYERLFRPDRCHYVGRLHEQVRRRDNGDAGKQARTDLLHFLHDGHREAVWADKRARNARLTGLQHDTDGQGTTDEDSYGADSVWRSPFEAARIAGDPATADQLYEQALATMPEWATWAKVKALSGRALYAGGCGRHRDAVRFGEEALALAPGDPAASVQLALAQHALGDRAAACEVLRRVGTAVGKDLVVVDRRMAEVYVPTMLGGLLLESGEAADVAEAASVLETTARRSPRAFDAYDVLATALRLADQEGWSDRFAAIIADTIESTGSLPPTLPAIIKSLSPDQQSQLQQALSRRGVQGADTVGATGSAAWSRVEPRLRTLGRAEVASLASDTEAKDPALALQMWEYIDQRTDSALGRARCLVALNELSAAGSALTGVVPAELAPPDILFVATLAAQLGDLALARNLLDGMPPELPQPLAAAASDLLNALNAAPV